jgi:hypothetical protein
MAMCKEEAVKLVKLNDEMMNQIKEILAKALDIKFNRTEPCWKPPLMLLAFNPEGQVSVVTSDNEFNGPTFGPELFKRIQKVTSIIPATFVTAIGSGVTSSRIGGQSLTDIWPWP